jgi:hypothetical protein
MSESETTYPAYASKRDAILATTVEGFASKRDVDQLVRSVRKEEKMRRRFEENSPVARPDAGWKLIVKRRFATGTEIYNVGCTIEVASLGANYAAMISSGFVCWKPPNTPITVQALPLPPPPAPPAPNPPIQIIHDEDVVASWKMSLAAMAASCGGDYGRARDLLLGDAKGSELYRRANRIDCLRRAEKSGVISVAPSPGF